MTSKQDWTLLNDAANIFGKLSFLVRFTVDTKRRKIYTKSKKVPYIKRFFLFTLVFCTNGVFSFYIQAWKIVFGDQAGLHSDVVNILRSSTILGGTIITSALLPGMFMFALAPEVVANCVNPFEEIFSIVKVSCHDKGIKQIGNASQTWAAFRKVCLILPTIITPIGVALTVLLNIDPTREFADFLLPSRFHKKKGIGILRPDQCGKMSPTRKTTIKLKIYPKTEVPYLVVQKNEVTQIA
ncbi:hypothetical protein Fcan01_21908 [Folsomia candida]|uniref:Uncharacterized protein n=1 Tax=Folsomia candida TaxID=158441 RepID=A0A226DDZ6_FOLCA|nr:hypothetical protein Fcan01_21906 [Folsomia candida]OXA43198.1 hypothetical protein Fcan01_21908 [Folsomia candida]